MNRLITIIACIFISTPIFSQKVSKKLLTEYEDTLQEIAYQIINGEDIGIRNNANDAFKQTLLEVLKYRNSFTFPFDSLVSISKLYSPDKSFRIFSWIMKIENNKFKYYGIVHYHNKRKKRYEIIELNDMSNEIRNPLSKDLDSKNWYGAYYYKIIYFKKKGRKFYTLLGKNWNNGISEKKIIDILYFGGKNKIKFGLPIIYKGKEKTKRFIIEYDAKASVGLNYSEKNKRIVFDYLVPLKENLEGFYEYYVPNGTYDCFEYIDGKWMYKRDIDIRNESIRTFRKKPKMGLINR
tara:strand:- start:591 stop:1472 length:882 start_codon:yes stop_codon:yes gene_type:complete